MLFSFFASDCFLRSYCANLFVVTEWLSYRTCWSLVGRISSMSTVSLHLKILSLPCLALVCETSIMNVNNIILFCSRQREVAR